VSAGVILFSEDDTNMQSSGLTGGSAEAHTFENVRLFKAVPGSTDPPVKPEDDDAGRPAARMRIAAVNRTS
jgi:hypothetical protein